MALFFTVLSNQTKTGTYGWFKNNKELINVATSRARGKLIILAIELVGKEHFLDEVVMNRNKMKNKIRATNDLNFIHVENSYARRYNHIKEIMLCYYSVRH